MKNLQTTNPAIYHLTKRCHILSYYRTKRVFLLKQNFTLCIRLNKCSVITPSLYNVSFKFGIWVNIYVLKYIVLFQVETGVFPPVCFWLAMHSTCRFLGFFFKYIECHMGNRCGWHWIFCSSYAGHRWLTVPNIANNILELWDHLALLVTSGNLNRKFGACHQYLT